MGVRFKGETNRTILACFVVSFTCVRSPARACHRLKASKLCPAEELIIHVTTNEDVSLNRELTWCKVEHHTTEKNNLTKSRRLIARPLDHLSPSAAALIMLCVASCLSRP